MGSDSRIRSTSSKLHYKLLDLQSVCLGNFFPIGWYTPLPFPPPLFKPYWTNPGFQRYAKFQNPKNMDGLEYVLCLVLWPFQRQNKVLRQSTSSVEGNLSRNTSTRLVLEELPHLTILHKPINLGLIHPCRKISCPIEDLLGIPQQVKKFRRTKTLSCCPHYRLLPHNSKFHGCYDPELPHAHPEGLLWGIQLYGRKSHKAELSQFAPLQIHANCDKNGMQIVVLKCRAATSLIIDLSIRSMEWGPAPTVHVHLYLLSFW